MSERLNGRKRHRERWRLEGKREGGRDRQTDTDRQTQTDRQTE